MQKVISLAVVYAIALPMLVTAVYSQDYPNRPLRLVTSEVGGGNDVQARIMMPALSAVLGQQIIIDNRPSGVTIGDIVAKSTPNGYTLLLYNNALWIAPLLQTTPFDTFRDFAPITIVTKAVNLLAVNPSVPVKSVKELIALAKSRPGQIAYSSSGNGSGGHLAAELLNHMAGIKTLHVPYKGGGPALVDLLAGQVQLLFSTQLSSWQHIQAGRIRALASSTAKRPSSLPDLPTIAESGLPGYDAGVWYAVLAPAGTPREIVTRLNGEVVRALAQPDYRKLLVNNTIEPIGSPPEQLAQYIKSELVKWAKVIKDANVRVD